MEPFPAVYTSFLQEPDNRMSVMIRSDAPGESMFNSLRGAVWSLDPDQPVGNVTTLSDILRTAASVSWQRFNLLILVGFGGIALLLAMLGIYGVVAQHVAHSTREIGIRVALGARKAEVVALFVRRGLLLASIGAALGLIVFFGIARFLESQLFATRATDPVPLLAVTTTLIASAVIACFVPARRAALVDPAVAMRSD
jgi:putative ABC transport system permease protein